MSPVSIVLVIADIVMGNSQQQSYFVQLMGLGNKVIKEQQENGRLTQAGNEKLQQYLKRANQYKNNQESEG